MKGLFYGLLICLVLVSCGNKTAEKEVSDVSDAITENVSDYKLDIYDFDGFEPFLSKKDDKTYVINFWATWCAPCVKELPYFEELNTKYGNDDVEVLLVSLDFPKQYEKKLIPFINKRKLESKVIALDDPKMNDWIPKIDEDWSGAIPATIIYNKEKSQFYERSFTFEELETELSQFINPKNKRS